MSFFEDFFPILLDSEQELDKETIKFYRDNPHELDNIINKEEFHLRFLRFFFILGLGIALISRVVKIAFGDHLGEFIVYLVLDLASELGIAIFGGAITAYIIEFLQKKQYERNVKFRNKVLAALKEENRLNLK